jgi:hypothetical protein
MNLPEYYISIEDKINDFKAYLGANDRAILSARFGDGKSTFLKEFAEKSEEEYILFTINPLHYQVTDNKDIFECIKRDILLQILSYIEFEEVFFSDSLMLYSYLYSNKLSVLDDIIDSIPKIDFKVISTDSMKNPIRNLIKNLLKFKKYKEQIESNTAKNKIENFITEFDNYKGSIYEFDPITQFICSINQKIKDLDSKKQIVLVIEDLDRIDPAHIFRILNILSAHIERYQLGVNESEITQRKNKFLFDKILLVCDFENIKYIFQHFYGLKTDFKGYISKFSSHKPYTYSLKDGYKDFILRKLDKDLMMFPKVMSLLVGMIIESDNTKTDGWILRDIDALLDMKFRMIRNELISIDNWTICSLNNLTKLLDILRAFSIDIKCFHENIISENIENEFHELIGLCWFIPVNKELAIEYSLRKSRVKTSGKLYSQQWTWKAEATICNDNTVTKIFLSIERLKTKSSDPCILDNLHLVVDYMSKFVTGYDQGKLEEKLHYIS